MPQNKVVALRRADSNDVDKIIRICRLFVHNVRYQTPIKNLKPLFINIMNSDSCEVYVASLNDEIVGFVILTLDLLEFEKIVNRNKPFFWIRFITILFHPTTLKYTLKKKWEKLMLNLFENKTTGNKTIKNNTLDSHYKEEIIISHIAVNNKYQRMGIAKYILCMIEKRAVELKRFTIKLNTFNIYKSAISLYESCGYVRSDKNNKNKDRIEFKKTIV